MSTIEQERARTRRSFTDEFKRDAVAMVVDEGHKIVDVATRLGVGEGTLGNWVRQERTNRGERAGLTTSEKAELRRENTDRCPEETTSLSGRAATVPPR